MHSDMRKKNPKLAEAVHLLEGAARDRNEDALFLLAEMNFYGNFTHPRNYQRAFGYYHDLATLAGNSTAQYMVGFMYATGIGGSVERHQGMALLYHTFAAMGGNIRSQMTVAFRRYQGIGVPRNCDGAVYWYRKVATQAVEFYRSGPPGGRLLTRDAYRWSDDEGGVYGEGASFVSSGINAKRDGLTWADASVEDVLEYLDLLAKKGEIAATYRLGKIHYEGTRNFNRDVVTAMRQFGQVARKYWAKDGSILANHPVGIEKTAAKAAAHIGVMFLRGEGVPQNFEKAKIWFQRGSQHREAMSMYYLGLMYLNGYYVEKDVIEATRYFRAAVEQDFPAAETKLGALFLDEGDVETAARYFELAARYGGIESFYYLAEMSNSSVIGERHCGVAAAYYKLVAEKAEELHSSLAEANGAYDDGDLETALIASLMAAEQGYEAAQANVAFLLDEQRSLLPLHTLLPISHPTRPALLRNAALALVYWTRSAKQTNIDSLVKMGDYYFYGYGTPRDLERAMTCYQSAADIPHSAQALWNIGWMHENGYAVGQDFHMAKRYYDLALETNEEAYLPVKLSLLKSRLRSTWNDLTHGQAHSIEPEPDTKPHRSLGEWIAAFVAYDDDDLHAEGDDALYSQEYADGTHGDYDDLEIEVEGSFLESLAILALAAVFFLLVYVRQQRVLRRRQEQNVAEGANANAEGNVGNMEEENAAEDQGLFPRPEDPDFGAWVAGGIGH